MNIGELIVTAVVIAYAIAACCYVYVLLRSEADAERRRMETFSDWSQTQGWIERWLMRTFK